MSTVIPDAWIIQEKTRRDSDKQRKDAGEPAIPISLPEPSGLHNPKPSQGTSKPIQPKEESVVIIDL